MKVLRAVFGVLTVMVVCAMGVQAQPLATNRNKVIIYPNGDESLDQLQKHGVTKFDSYGSYWVAEATDDQLGTLQQHYGTRLQKANYLFRIELNAMPVDTSVGEPGMQKSLAQATTAGKRLRLRAVWGRRRRRRGRRQQLRRLP